MIQFCNAPDECDCPDCAYDPEFEARWDRIAWRLWRREIKRCRKARTCDSCGREIPVGFPCVRISGLFDTIFGQVFRHPICDE